MCYSIPEISVISIPTDKVQLSIATDMLRVKGVSYRESEKEINARRDDIARAFSQVKPNETP